MWPKTDNAKRHQRVKYQTWLLWWPLQGHTVTRTTMYTPFSYLVYTVKTVLCGYVMKLLPSALRLTEIDWANKRLKETWWQHFNWSAKLDHFQVSSIQVDLDQAHPNKSIKEGESLVSIHTRYHGMMAPQQKIGLLWCVLIAMWIAGIHVGDLDYSTTYKSDL